MVTKCVAYDLYPVFSHNHPMSLEKGFVQKEFLALYLKKFQNSLKGWKEFHMSQLDQLYSSLILSRPRRKLAWPASSSLLPHTWVTHLLHWQRDQGNTTQLPLTLQRHRQPGCLSCPVQGHCFGWQYSRQTVSDTWGAAVQTVALWKAMFFSVMLF